MKEKQDDEDEEAANECDEETIIRADGHKPYWFEMFEGQELVASITAEDFIDIVICNEQDFDAWSNQDEDEWPAHYFLAEDVGKKRFEFVAPMDGTFIVLLINWTEQDIEATVDIAVWDTEDEEETI